jgi:hypothetical protein
MSGSDPMSHVSEFSLITFPETFVKSSRDLVTGEISVRLGDTSFPDAHWNDFVVVIMSWWLEEILKIVTGTGTRSYCRFMDGPYWFAIDVRPHDRMVVRCMEKRKVETCTSEGVCVRESVLSAMLSAADVVIRKCQEESWFSSDLESLVSSSEALHKYYSGRSEP